MKKKWAFLGFTIAFFVWLIGTFLAYSSKNEQSIFISASITYAGVSLISPSLYCYVSVWLGRFHKNRWILLSGFLLAVIMWGVLTFTEYIFYGARKYYWGYHSQLTIAGGAAFLLFFIGYMALFFKVLYEGYQEESDRLKKRQIVFVAIAFGIAYLGSSDFLPCYGIEIFPTGGLMTVAATVALSYTIIRYKMLDIETVIHRTLLWAGSTVVAILPFAALLYLLQKIFKNQAIYFQTTYLLLILISFSYYFQYIQPKLGHWLRLKSANLDRTMVAFSRRLTHLNGLRTLLQRLARTIQRAIHVGKVAIYVYDEATQMMLPAMSKQIHGLKPLGLNEPYLHWLERKNRVVVTRLIVSDPDISDFKDAFMQHLEDIDAAVLVPFIHNGKLIGLMYLGKKESLKKYSFYEVNFLSNLRVPVSIALSNSIRLEDVSKLYKELQTLNEELEQRVEERTKELIETQGQLIQAEKLATLGTMAGGVAHEINNPLTAVLANAQILKMSAQEDDIELIDMIEEGAKRCQEITRKLLNYARKETQSETFAVVNLYGLVVGISNFLNYQLKQEGLILSISSHTEDVCVQGVKSELEQVLTNFILNSRDAILATKRNDGKIKIALSEVGEDVILSVEDNGIGIPEKNISKIFDPFFTTKEVGSGTGLGLSVSMGILQKHNVKIDVTSKVNSGTKIQLIFKKG